MAKRDTTKIKDLFGNVAEDDVKFDVEDSSSNPETEKRLRELEGQVENALVPAEDGEFLFRGFRLTRVGLAPNSEVNEDDWVALGDALGHAGDAWQFWVGDYANQNRDIWGSSYDDTAKLFGLEVETVTDLAYVCRTIQFSLRNENLKFTLTN